MKALLARLFKRTSSIYGPRIFLHRSWLAKQVDDAIWERSQQIGLTLPPKKIKNSLP